MGWFDWLKRKKEVLIFDFQQNQRRQLHGIVIKKKHLLHVEVFSLGEAIKKECDWLINLKEKKVYVDGIELTDHFYQKGFQHHYILKRIRPSDLNNSRPIFYFNENGFCTVLYSFIW